MKRKPPSRERRALALMERVLRGGGEIAPEYPLVFGPEATGEIVALEEDGEVRSTCAILVRDLIIGHARVRAGLIGSVSTDPAWRGNGFATRVLAFAEERLAQCGCSLALLWADEADFYRARGWREFGGELDFAFDASILERTLARDGIRAAAPDDSGAIHRLYWRHESRVERTPRETAQLLATPSMETLILQEAEEVRAYACLGRGADFAHTIHEWGGSAADVLALVRTHVERSLRRGEGEEVFLIAPTTARELQALARGVGARESRGVLALAKPLDLAPLAELFAESAGALVRATVDADSTGGSACVIDGGARKLHLSAQDLLDVLFPARGACDRLGEIERALDVSLPSLPLAPFLWGLDSI